MVRTTTPAATSRAETSLTGLGKLNNSRTDFSCSRCRGERALEVPHAPQWHLADHFVPERRPNRRPRQPVRCADRAPTRSRSLREAVRLRARCLGVPRVIVVLVDVSLDTPLLIP